MLEYERKFWKAGESRLAGVDEAGRGPLAGPVIAAAVVFDPAFAKAEETETLFGLNDSKQLSESRRDFFFRLLATCRHVEIGIGISTVEEIDRLNILRATHVAMRRAVENLPSLPDRVLVDGLPVQGLPCVSTAIVGGDARSLSIAAASVMAKVIRDSRMKELDLIYPAYGFARHKGYGSGAHIQALLEFGPSPVHRMSFRPVREAADLRARAERNPAASP